MHLYSIAVFTGVVERYARAVHFILWSKRQSAAFMRAQQKNLLPSNPYPFDIYF